tara:strand:+ start:330 stop:590 length:261 start_codon:yes stop_codon:yes gene_type:complete
MIGIGISVDWGGSVSATGAIVADFVKRVIADGGTVESPACLRAAINAIGNADSPTSLFAAYNLRVVAAGGTTEAKACTITKLQQTI